MRCSPTQANISQGITAWETTYHSNAAVDILINFFALIVWIDWSILALLNNKTCCKVEILLQQHLTSEKLHFQKMNFRFGGQSI